VAWVEAPPPAPGPPRKTKWGLARALAGARRGRQKLPQHCRRATAAGHPSQGPAPPWEALRQGQVPQEGPGPGLGRRGGGRRVGARSTQPAPTTRPSPHARARASGAFLPAASASRPGTRAAMTSSSHRYRGTACARATSPLQGVRPGLGGRGSVRGWSSAGCMSSAGGRGALAPEPGRLAVRGHDVRAAHHWHTAQLLSP
jgi:hypothetical protein